MRRRSMIANVLTLAALAGAAATPAPAQDTDPNPVVVIDTSAGPITVELDRAKAPTTVANFLQYVDKGFFDGLIFHRVIPGFMIQGGGMTEVNGRLQEKTEGAMPPIKNESGNGISNARGTIAMARTSDPNSATSQFFINHGNNANLDNYGGGYAAFGKVTDGMEVVDAIAKVQTTTKLDARGLPNGDVPVKVVTIKSIKRKVKS
ncbi:peptidylprolyl isomerase [Tundrisphaera sp. TA3]|uniref:peptidylprolyl isomerase n=1 Tax=Tundrisphaera sp. TA3 TaxID=3435775 RepID=UPI003EBABEA9